MGDFFLKAKSLLFLLQFILRGGTNLDLQDNFSKFLQVLIHF